MKNFALILSTIALFTCFQAQAITFRENILFSAKLEGTQMVPAVNSAATGLGSFMLNRKRDSISINISLRGISATQVAIYHGKEGSNGVLLFDLSGFLDGNIIRTKLNGATVISNLSKWMSNDLYLVVSTADHPNGEIRGQIKMESSTHFMADLKGAEVVPSVPGNAYGLGSFELSMDHDKLKFNIICQNLSGAISTAKLHVGAMGVAGPEIENLTAMVNGNVISGSLTPSPSLLASLFAGEVYLNISTASHPMGEIRSQMRLSKGLVFDALATGQRMVPVIQTEAKAIGIFRLSPALDTLFYDIVLDQVNTNIDYAHLHVGYAGLAYGALQVDFTNNISGHRIKGFKKGSEVNTTTINRLLISNLALIVHTAEYPMGEIRGDIVRYAHEGFSINLSGDQVVPAVTTSARGAGIVSISRDESLAHYMWVASGFNSQPTAAKFNEGLAGAFGPTLYNMTGNMSASDQDAASFGYWKSTDSSPFSAGIATKFSNNSVYLEISSAEFPDGEIRGQVRKGTVFYSPTSGTEDQLGNQSLEVVVAPNPAKTQLTLQFGTLESGQLQVKMLDVSGKTVLEDLVSPISETSVIDVSTLKPGFYFLEITDGHKTSAKKIVIGA